MNIRVLLVDDSADDRTLVARELMRHFGGVDVLHAGTADALEAALAGGGFDVAITDYRLRFTDGLQVLRALKRRHPDRPVIMFTASGSEEIAVEAMKEGLDDYITKTAKHYPRIGYAVRACLDHADRRRELEWALARETLAKQDLERQRAQLEKADRQKSDFLAILAHELRNPLAAAGYSVALLRRDGIKDGPAGRATEVIERQIGHMARLLDELLDLSRITHNRVELDRQPLDLRRIVELACDGVRPALQASAHVLDVALPSQPVVVDGDEVRLTQVLGNLLGNAAKFTPRAGRIAIRITVEDDAALLEVSDNGVGIDPARLEDVFDMFSQGQAKAHGGPPGLGIGLAVARSLVELHGGTVTAHSAGQDEGTTVRVRLPLARPAAQEAAPEHAAPLPAAEPAFDVLLADDNADAVDMLAEFLRLHGYVVHTAYDGQAAIDLAATVRPRVILLDIGMPRATGYDVARWVRAQPWGERTLLAAVTGWGREHDNNRAVDAGFDLRFVKPVDMDQLLGALATVDRTDAARPA